MTDEEIVARALEASRTPDADMYGGGRSWQEEFSQQARAVVAALTEAGRLLPDGMVCIEMEREDLLP